MPLPKPSKGEKEKDFISRCMSDLSNANEFDSKEQRLAVCYSRWKNKENIILVDRDILIENKYIIEKNDLIEVL